MKKIKKINSPMTDFRISDFAYSKIAHADLGKNARARVPALAVDDLVEQLEAELVKLVAEQEIENKELADAVADEGELDEQVEHHEIVAEKLARYATNAGQEALEKQEAAASLFASARVVHVLIDGREHVRHVLLPTLVLVHRLVVGRRLDNVTHVYARAARQRTPCDVWNVEEKRLRE